MWEDDRAMKVELSRVGGVLGVDKHVSIDSGKLEVVENGATARSSEVAPEEAAAIEAKVAELPVPAPPSAPNPELFPASDGLDTYLRVETSTGEAHEYPVVPGQASAVSELAELIERAEAGSAGGADAGNS
jgi:hypothetical protein